MTKRELFAGWNERMFLDDPAAVAAYCRLHWPQECEHIVRVADEVCRGYFLFDLKWDMERTWEPVEFPGGRVDGGRSGVHLPVQPAPVFYLPGPGLLDHRGREVRQAFCAPADGLDHHGQADPGDGENYLENFGSRHPGRVLGQGHAVF